MIKFTICLVNIAAKFRGVEDLTRPPTGLLYVGNALKQAGFNVRIYHIREEEIDTAIDSIVLENPLWVGFSVFTGFPCYTSAVMSEKIKEKSPSTTIIWGGVHSSIIPEQCLQEPFIDYVVIGEGELTAVELSQKLAAGLIPHDVKGIGYKLNGNFSLNPPREHIADLDQFKMDWSLVNINDYIRPSADYQKTLCFATSRGCPHNCGFCYNGRFHKSRWRAHSVEYVIREIEQMKAQTGITRISFDDDQFMADIKRSFAILSQLYKRDIICDWLACRLEMVTVENIRQLQELGIKRIFFGWESGNNRILKLINKKFTQEYVYEKCNILSQFPDIAYSFSAIIGFPTETKQDIQLTIDAALEISRLLPSAGFNLGTYMPYPGSPLYAVAVQEGFIPPKNVFEWKDFDILTGTVELSWLSWSRKNTKTEFAYVDGYVKLLDRGITTAHKRRSLKMLIKNMLYHIARLRLKHFFFIFPIEVILKYRWNKYRISKSINRFKNAI